MLYEVITSHPPVGKPLDTMGNKGVVSGKLLLDKKGEAYGSRNDHHATVYSRNNFV